MSTPPATHSHALARHDTLQLGASMSRILASPLAALRASIESLVAEIGRQTPQARLLEGALEQVTRMAGDVQSLVDLAEPRALAPLRCSLDEVARSAIKRLSDAHRARVQYAHPGATVRVVLDGPLLSTCLAGLLHAALERSTDRVLLQVRGDSRRAYFVLVQGDAEGSYDPGDVSLDGAPREAATSVRLAVAKRDIERMGGEIRVEHTARGLTCVSVAIDDASIDTATRTGDAA